MRFAKMHGLGNDFVLRDLRSAGARAGTAGARDAAGRDPTTPEMARRLCDRHRGIGADGVLTLSDAEGGAVRLVVHNADGSIPEMCGNGARCAALWVATGAAAHPARASVLLLTDAGPRPCAVEAEQPGRGDVEVEMGVPATSALRRMQQGAFEARAMPVSMGNPHLVFLLGEEPLERLFELAARHGPALSLAENANVEFVARRSAQRYAAVVWERGAGLTQACGTGACAVAAAAIASGDAQAADPIFVELPGGTLRIARDPDTGQLKMRGPAELVFVGDC